MKRGSRFQKARTYGPMDMSWRLLADGYDFWPRLRERQASEVVRTRLLGSPAICIYGEEAARFFYTETALERSSALPQFFVGSLFGAGAVHGLDNEAHRQRKSMFNAILDAGALKEICEQLERLWKGSPLQSGSSVDVFTDASIVIFGAACRRLGTDPGGEGPLTAIARHPHSPVLSLRALSGRPGSSLEGRWISNLWGPE